jgi:hypothetical protein
MYFKPELLAEGSFDSVRNLGEDELSSFDRRTRTCPLTFGCGFNLYGSTGGRS